MRMIRVCCKRREDSYDIVCPEKELLNKFDSEDIEDLKTSSLIGAQLTYDDCVVAEVTGENWDAPETFSVVECDETRLPIVVEHPETMCYPVYRTPDSETPDTIHTGNEHLEDCYLGHYYSKDFAYFHCPICERMICEQNPSNGYITQYRLVNSELICNSCVKMDLLDGVNWAGYFGRSSENPVENGVRICDMDQRKLMEAPQFEKESIWEPFSDRIRVPSLFNIPPDNWVLDDDYFIHGPESIRRVNLRALELIAGKNYVMLCLDCISILGNEGYASIYYRPVWGME